MESLCFPRLYRGVTIVTPPGINWPPIVKPLSGLCLYLPEGTGGCMRRLSLITPLRCGLVAVINIDAAQLHYQSLLVIPMLCKFQKDEDQSRCYCIAGSPQLNLLLMLERDIPSAIIIVTASPLSQSRSSIIVFVFLEASMSQCDTSALSPSIYANLVYIAKGYSK
jgi:hypothetical protein